jgi:folate-dependent phosphoribosylglycinamide formyltransferase PurN
MRLMILTHASPSAVTIIERLLALDCAEVAGIFVETEITRPRPLAEKIKRSIRYDGLGGTLKKYAGKLLKAIPTAQAHQGSAPSDNPQRLSELTATYRAPLHRVRNFHLPESLRLMRDCAPDLGVVLGTNILKESVFSIPRRGSINTHQGLAPYYRGGPPVFWELFNGEREVGLTVHFVAAKVDTGDIILQESLPLVYDYAYGLNYEPFIADMRDRLSKRAAELVPQAIERLAAGTADLQPQNIELGKRYLLPVKKEKDELRRRLRQRRRQAGSPITGKAEVSNR